MKLFVQARKDGYNVLYPKPTPTEFFQFAGDIRPDSKDPNLLGKFIYTIAFANGGCIFTKHVIVQDVKRQGLGNIGFSVFIPNIRKLSGYNVIKLLDELLNTYCINYCPDYYLENKPEDWAIFEAITNQYEDKLYNLSNADTENYQQGPAEAAFVYYMDKIELCKFFDAPYQEEYSSYKQIFFVEKNLEGKSENPLNALRHDSNANLTGKIDLENPSYKLIYNQQARGGIKIEVKVNGGLRYSKSKITRKEDLEIKWSKQFCETKVIRGKWYEIGSDFLEINDIEKIISVKEIEFHPITYTFTIQTKDRSSNPIVDAEIILKGNNYLPERKAINNSIQLTAEELQNKCYIIAKKENLISPQREIKLEDTKGSISLILSEHKKVKFQIADERGLVYNYSIQILNKEIQPKDGEVEFTGEEIDKDKSWQILVSHRDYETERFNYCPAKDENPKYVTLKKKAFGGQWQSPYKKKYYIKIDESKGKRSFKGLNINEYEYKYPQYKCDARYGYKFDSWGDFENKPYDNYDGYYEAIFRELWYRKIPKLAWIFLFIAIVATTSFLLIKSDINHGKIDEPKDKVFLKPQQNSKNAIHSIDYKCKKQIDDTLNTRKVSAMDSIQAAEILKIQKLKEKKIAIQKKIDSLKNTNQEKQNEKKSKDQQKNNNQNPQTQKQQPSANSLEKEFWNLVKKPYLKKEDFDKLFEKTGWNNDYKTFYNDYLRKRNSTPNKFGFDKFVNVDIADRAKAKILTDLESLIKKQ